MIVLPQSSQYHVEAIYGICDGDHDEPPSGSTGAAGGAAGDGGSGSGGSGEKGASVIDGTATGIAGGAGPAFPDNYREHPGWSADHDNDGEAAGLAARIAQLEGQVVALQQLERENQELKAQLRQQGQGGLGGGGGSSSSNGPSDTITTTTMPSIGEGGTAADGASNTGNAIKTTPGIIRDGGSMAGSSTSTV